MSLTLTEKILQAHIIPDACPDTRFVPGEPIRRGDDIAIRIDQTLTQDATGTMTYLQFETIGVPRVKTELSVSYVDHNTLQTITVICSALPKNTVFIFRGRETAFVIKYTSNVSESRVKRCSAATVTRRPAAVSA